MPTTVTHSIGTTGRDYSTLQAWEDACPANLVTADQIWRGECYNDSEFYATTSGTGKNLTIDGTTSDATRYKHLTAATGQSFQDHATVRTNALKYDVSKGVGIRQDGQSGGADHAIFLGTVEKFVHISRLQIKVIGSAATTGQPISCGSDFSTSTSIVLNDLLCDGVFAATTLNDGSATNCVFIRSTALDITVMFCRSAMIFTGCTMVACSDLAVGTDAVCRTANTFGGNPKLISCALFGAHNAISGTWDTASNHNATNFASGLPGTSNQHSVTYNATTPFVGAASSAIDLRAVAATTLAANGFLDSTNAPNDISLTARAATPTIGAWELAAVGAIFWNVGDLDGIGTGGPFFNNPIG